jgi:hypothetical protein
MNELETGIGFSFTVFPQSPVLLQPREVALDDPAFGHDLKNVQFAAFGDPHGDLLAPI